LLRGRVFRDADRVGAPPVVILNQTMAHALFGDSDPVGRVIRIAERPESTVVGVVRNSKYVSVGESEALALYTPFAQKRAGSAHFFVRARGDPLPLLHQVEAALSKLDPGATVETHAMSEALRMALIPSRVGAAVTGTTAGLGLILASIGLYGVLVYSVSRRVREIGIRMALGASPARIVATVASDGVRLVLVGLAIGLSLAVVAVRPLANFLVPEVRPTDPTNFVMVAAVLLVVTAAAMLVPTLRALRIDPADSLRHE
jgi:ABC-type antimicrobial peptide transport system permease subunit